MKKSILFLTLTLAGAGLAVVALLQLTNLPPPLAFYFPPEKSAATRLHPDAPQKTMARPIAAVSPTPAEDDLPHDKLFITPERQKYRDGQLRLIIPKLDVDIPVLNGTSVATLSRGVGLYDYAQLPGEGNRNVSIAGHRNGLRRGVITDNMPFYYVDTLEDGDCLYLRDSEHIYQYRWHSQEVITPDNWGPIYSQGFSCLTLTTCTPIGIADHRLVVRGELVQILDADADFDYPAALELPKADAADSAIPKQRKG